MTPLPDRLPNRSTPTAAAARKSAWLTSGGCTGSADHTHASGGLTAPPFFVPRRFHTM
nr:hypothetical protein [Protofrankia sp. BMG5.30]